MVSANSFSFESSKVGGCLKVFFVRPVYVSAVGGGSR